MDRIRCRSLGAAIFLVLISQSLSTTIITESTYSTIESTPESTTSYSTTPIPDPVTSITLDSGICSFNLTINSWLTIDGGEPTYEYNVTIFQYGELVYDTSLSYSNEEFSDFLPGSYNVCVEAFPAEVSWKSHCKEILIESDIITPPVLEVGSCSIQSSWDLSKECKNVTNTYNIEWTGDDSVPGNITIYDTSFTIRELSPGNYNVCVMAYSYLYDPLYDTKICNDVLLDSDIITPPVLEVGSCSIQSSWDLTQECKNVVNTYNIEWTGDDSVPGNITIYDTNFTITELSPGNYNVCVMAYSYLDDPLYDTKICSDVLLDIAVKNVLLLPSACRLDVLWEVDSCPSITGFHITSADDAGFDVKPRANDTKWIYTGLPQNNYTVCVQALDGNAGYGNIVCGNADVYAQQLNITSKPVDDDGNMLVQWHEAYPECAVTSFKISWREDGNEPKWTDQATTEKNSFTIPHLQDCTSYTISVVASEGEDFANSEQIGGGNPSVLMVNVTTPTCTTITTIWAPCFSDGLQQYSITWREGQTGDLNSAKITHNNQYYYTIDNTTTGQYTGCIQGESEHDEPVGLSRCFIREKILPAAPPSLSVSMVIDESNNLRVTWSDQNTICPINGYRICWHEEQWYNEDMLDDGNCTDINAVTKFDITGLKPHTRYNVNVTARIDDKCGPTSTWHDNTDQDLPEEPENVVISSPDAKTLQVTWDPPEVTNGVIQGYTVEWGIHNSKMSSPELTNTSYTIRDLIACTRYDIYVKAKTIKGYNINSMSHEFSTIPEVEKENRINLTVTSKGSTQLQVDWVDANAPCPIFGFIITYMDMSSDFKNTENITDNSTRDFTIYDLIPFTKYKIQINSEFQVGSGPQEEKEITTDQDVPGPPTMIEVEDVNNRTQLKIKWQKPEKPNGIIEGYKVKWDYNYGVIVNSNDSLDDTTISYTLPELPICSVYSVTVTAKTMIGFGEPVTIDGSKIKSSESSVDCDCPSETPFPDLFPAYEWNKFFINETLNQSCPSVNDQGSTNMMNAVWTCGFAKTWRAKPDLSQCQSPNFTAGDYNIDEIADILYNMTSNGHPGPSGQQRGSLNSGDILGVLDFLEEQKNTRSTSVENIINIYDMLLQEPLSWEGLPSEQRLISVSQLLQDLGDDLVAEAKNLPRGGEMSYHTTTISAKLQAFPDKSNRIYVHPNFTDSKLILPGDITDLSYVVFISFSNLDCIIHGCPRSYERGSFPKESQVIGSPVMGIVFENMNSEYYEMEFNSLYHTDVFNVSSMKVMSWDMANNIWKNDNCNITNLDDTSSVTLQLETIRVSCKGTSLNTFAVTLQYDGKINEDITDSLSEYMIYILCAGGMACLMVTLAAQIMQEVNTDDEWVDKSLQLHITFSLLAFELILLIGIDAPTESTRCRVIAGLATYCLLSIFSGVWVEKIHVIIAMYKAAKKDSEDDNETSGSKRKVLETGLLSLTLAIPGVLLALPLGFNDLHQTCGIDEPSSEYENSWIFGFPGTIVVTVNILVLGIMYVMIKCGRFKSSSQSVEDTLKHFVQVSLTTVVHTAILGLPYLIIFILVVIGKDPFALWYTLLLTNCIQSIALTLFNLLRNPEVFINNAVNFIAKITCSKQDGFKEKLGNTITAVFYVVDVSSDWLSAIAFCTSNDTWSCAISLSLIIIPGIIISGYIVYKIWKSKGVSNITVIFMIMLVPTQTLPIFLFTWFVFRDRCWAPWMGSDSLKDLTPDYIKLQETIFESLGQFCLTSYHITNKFTKCYSVCNVPYCSTSQANVCGNDLQTYDNPCSLLQSSCNEPKKRLFQMYKGGCREPSTFEFADYVQIFSTLMSLASLSNGFAGMLSNDLKKKVMYVLAIFFGMGSRVIIFSMVAGIYDGAMWMAPPACAILLIVCLDAIETSIRKKKCKNPMPVWCQSKESAKNQFNNIPKMLSKMRKSKLLLKIVKEGFIIVPLTLTSLIVSLMYLAWVSYIFVFCNDETLKTLALTMIIVGQFLSCVFTKVADILSTDNESDPVSKTENKPDSVEKPVVKEKRRKSKKEMNEDTIIAKQNIAKAVWNGELTIIEPESSSEYDTDSSDSSSTSSSASDTTFSQIENVEGLI